jgi:hypothetical protein
MRTGIDWIEDDDVHSLAWVWSPGYKLISKPPGRVVAFPQSWSSSSSSRDRDTQGGPRRRRRSFQSSPFPNDLILFVSSIGSAYPTVLLSVILGKSQRPLARFQAGKPKGATFHPYRVPGPRGRENKTDWPSSVGRVI